MPGTRVAPGELQETPREDDALRFLNDGGHRNPTTEAAAAAGALPEQAMPLVLWPRPPGHRRHLRRRTAAPGVARFAGDFQSAAKASLPMAGTGANSPSFRLRQPCASFLLRRGSEPPVPLPQRQSTPAFQTSLLDCSSLTTQELLQFRSLPPNRLTRIGLSWRAGLRFLAPARGGRRRYRSGRRVTAASPSTSRPPNFKTVKF